MSWGPELSNARCVDAFNVFYWMEDVGQGWSVKKTLEIKDGAKKSAIVEVEPCARYRFQVELVERELFKTDKKLSPEASFQTAGQPRMKDRSKSKYQVRMQHFGRNKCMSRIIRRQTLRNF